MLNRAQTLRVLAKMDRFLLTLEPMLFRSVCRLPVTGFETAERMNRVPEASRFQPFLPGARWGGDGKTGWFCASYTVPEALSGQDLFVRPHVGGMEAMLWVNGAPFGTFTGKNNITGNGNHHTGLLCKDAKAGETVDIALEAYAGHYVPGCVPLYTMPMADFTYPVEDLEIVVKDPLVQDFYFDLKTFLQMTRVLDEESYIRAEIVRTLLAADRILYYAPKDVSEAAFRAAIGEASAILKPLYAHKNGDLAPIANVVGHSHIDTAWQWPMAETVRKCARTFSNQLSLMQQYPEYRFMQSTSYHAEMMRQRYPSVFSGMQQAAKEGRWEPNGGAWVECDCNIVSGETLVREFLWGQLYTRKYFGYTSNCFWLPDTFGYSAAIPQIMRGAGLKYFLTTKIAWNDTNTFPYDTFYWQGIDGSKVLAHFNKMHLWPDPETCIDLVCNGKKSGDTVREKTVAHRRLLAYGFGDGGGGPQYEMIEMARRIKDLAGCPKVETTRVDRFLETLESELGDTPVYRGELYLEGHRGTLTNQHNIKRQYRRAERALHNAEYLAVRAGADESALRADVNTILVNGFHDILPGTCIHEAHEQAIRELGDAAVHLEQCAANHLAALSAPENGLTLVNTLSAPRCDVQYIETEQPLACRGQWVVGLDGRRRFAADGVKLAPFGTAFLPFAAETEPGESPFRFDGKVLETPLYRAEFDEKLYIASLWDKKAEREVRGDGLPLGALIYGEDVPFDWDNWDVDADLEAKLTDCAACTERAVVDDGPVEFRLRARYAFPGGTEVLRDVVFYAAHREIRFETRIDWRVHHRFMKVCFDTSVAAETARSEIQFGYVQRPTHRNTTLEQAKFEVSNQKYTDLSETRYGAAVLNDCKYGISAEGGKLRLSLHKGGNRPDTAGDLGVHDCTYVLLPHDSGFSAGDVVWPAYRLNHPALVTPGRASLPPFVLVREENIVLETVKPAEDGNGYILRFYEAEGAQTPAHIELPQGASAVETNLLEEPTGAPALRGACRLHFGPFEIKTLRVTQA